MKMFTVRGQLAAACVVALSLAGGSVAAADGPHDKAIKARQAMFQLYSFSIGTLGGMAKGKIEYNAEAAVLAAEAGNGLDALRAAIGDVGKSCKGCHDEYRAKKK